MICNLICRVNSRQVVGSGRRKNIGFQRKSHSEIGLESVDFWWGEFFFVKIGNHPGMLQLWLCVKRRAFHGSQNPRYLYL